ncbi:hypothetical protein [Colwellia piezophila]|uniref:hypothetical protein n=1 Tax=Colwellia piezophila TaxID=211668 RepID=UPI0003792E37|nr:hypothetical protein [Colwellia piezophila]
MKHLSVLLFALAYLCWAPNVVAEEDDELGYEVGPDTYKENPEYDDWNYLVAFPMIWAPSINGSIDSEGEILDIEIPFSDIFKNLNFGVIGELYAQKGKWLYSLRLDYMHVSSSTDTEGLTGPLTGGIIAPAHRIETTIQMAANDLLVGYELYPGLRLLTGVRHIYAKVDLAVSPLSDDGFIHIDNKFNISKTHDFDWLVGVTYRYWFSDDWGIAASVDTKIYGDNDRDRGFNAQAIYRFGGLHNVWIGYRYLEIGNDSVENGISTKVDFIQHGPQLGWAFTF